MKSYYVKFLMLFAFFVALSYQPTRASDEEKEKEYETSHFHSSNDFEEEEEEEKPRIKNITSPLSIDHIAEFFLMKDQERKNGGGQGEPVDNLKLQKLCYYAQGFHLALYGKPIFEEDVVAFRYGPYEKELNLQYAHFEKNPIQWDKDISFDGYSAECRFFLDIIYEMKRMKSGKQLINDTHAEQPYLETKKEKGLSLDSVIELQVMKDFFESFDEVANFFSIVNKYYILSKVTFNPLDFAEDPNQYLWQGGISHKLYDNVTQKCTSIIAQTPFNIYQWPHQNLFQALMAYLFFPQELENEVDSDIYLYGKDYIHEGLAFSARYQNPLAIYHLSRIFELYSNEAEEDQVKAWGSEFEKQLSDYLNTEEVQDYDTYPRALIYSLLGEDEKAKDCLDKTLMLEDLFNQEEERVDPKVAYLRALFRDKDKGERIRLYKVAAEGGIMRAYLGLARLQSNYDTAFELYKTAGAKGVPEGYFQVGDMLVKGYVFSNDDLTSREEQAIEYFKQAGELGMISAYEVITEIYRARGKGDELEKLYKEQKDTRDPYVYYELGKFHEEHGNLEKAKKYYQKSGIALGQLKTLRLEGKKEDEVKKARLNHFEHLYLTALKSLN